MDKKNLWTKIWSTDQIQNMLEVTYRSPINGAACFVAILSLLILLQRVLLSPQFDIALTIPVMNPSGIDFRIVGEAGLSFINGTATVGSLGSGHPPIEMLILGAFLKLFSSPYKYFAVFLSTLLPIGILTASLSSSSIGKLEASLTTIFLSGFLIGTYPTLFAIERGNTDLISFAATAIFLLGLSRKNLFLAGSMLFFAVNIKIYSLVFLSFFWLHSNLKKLVIMILAIPLGFMVMGKTGLEGFLISLTGLIEQPYVWDGNHSLFSWFTTMGLTTKFGYNLYTIVRMTIVSVFGLMCLVEKIIRINEVRLKFDEKLRYAALLGMATSLCCLLPPTSHDYRIPIVILPWVLFTCGMTTTKSLFGQLWFLVITTSTAALFTNRDFIFSKTSVLLCYYSLFCSFYLVTLFSSKASLKTLWCSPMSRQKITQLKV